MKSLNNYVLEYICNEMMLDIDQELFCETLLEPHLIKVAKWLRDFGSKHKNSWANHSFSGIFGQWDIAWDKVTEEDFKRYDAGDAAGIKDAIAVHKQGDKFQRNLVLFLDGKDNIFALLTCYGIKMINTDQYAKAHPKHKVTDKYGYEYEETDWDSWEDVKVAPDASFQKQLQKDTRDLCNKCAFMILNLNDKKFSVNNIQRDRRTSREGMITPDMYSSIAIENRERYKKIIAKNKAERLAKNDKLSIEVNNIVTKVLELTQKVMLGGAKYADLEYKIGYLLESCYGKKVWTGNTRHGQTGYTGSDGILALFSMYVKANMGAAGNSTYRTDDASKLIAPVRKKIDSINKQIEEIEAKM